MAEVVLLSVSELPFVVDRLPRLVFGAVGRGSILVEVVSRWRFGTRRDLWFWRLGLLSVVAVLTVERCRRLLLVGLPSVVAESFVVRGWCPCGFCLTMSSAGPVALRFFSSSAGPTSAPDVVCVRGTSWLSDVDPSVAAELLVEK